MAPSSYTMETAATLLRPSLNGLRSGYVRISEARLHRLLSGMIHFAEIDILRMPTCDARRNE